MVKLLNLESKVRFRVKRSRNSVFLLRDFDDLSDRNQVGRVLRKLIKQELLVKLGYGMYSRAKRSTLSDKIIPEKGLIAGGKEILDKLKIKTYPTRYETMYNNFQSTQVPTGRVIAVDSRITRKISFGGISLKYERVGVGY
jgi:hypothetical protein